MKAITKRNIPDLIVAAVFLILGIYLLANGNRYPSGAGFFPMVLGVVITVLSVGLIGQSLHTLSEASFQTGTMKTLLGVVLLTLVYLLMWGSGGFAIRTFVFLTILLRMLGESWRTGAAVSAVLSTVVTLAFKYGLHVSLE